MIVIIVSPIQICYCIISYIRLDCVICFMNFSYFLYSSWLFAIPQAKTHIFKLRLLLIETSIVQSVTKFMGKTGIWTTSCSYPISPFNNVKKHCIGGERGFKHTFWNSHNILPLNVWNLQQQQKMRYYACCFK